VSTTEASQEFGESKSSSQAAETTLARATSSKNRGSIPGDEEAKKEKERSSVAGESVEAQKRAKRREDVCKEVEQLGWGSAEQ
jgi:hypothetical protein